MKILQISYKHAIACSIACFLAILPVYSQEYINVVAGSNFYNYYAYNSNGALTRDDSRGIMMIQYDNMNYPQTIQFFNGNQTEYTYSVSGEKLCTIRRTVEPNTTKHVNWCKVV